MAENELEQQPAPPQPVQTTPDDSLDTFDDRIGVMFILLLVLW